MEADKKEEKLVLTPEALETFKKKHFFRSIFFRPAGEDLMPTTSFVKTVLWQSAEIISLLMFSTWPKK